MFYHYFWKHVKKNMWIKNLQYFWVDISIAIDLHTLRLKTGSHFLLRKEPSMAACAELLPRIAGDNDNDETFSCQLINMKDQSLYIDREYDMVI